MKVFKNEDSFDPRVLRTRQLIEEAFVALLEEKSYAEITVKKITEIATVNRATFYSHFIDKDDLFRNFIRNSFNQVLKEKLSDNPGSEVEFLTSLLTAVFEYMDWLRGKCSTTKKDKHVPLPEKQIQIRLEDIVLSWLRQKKTENCALKIDPEIQAIAISSATVAVAYKWSRKIKMKRPAPEKVIDQLRTMISGLLNVASIKTH